VTDVLCQGGGVPAADHPSRRPRVAVVGGGISGLTAAWRLSAHGVEVVVLEQSGAAGGKLRLGRVGDLMVDVGAEAVLARRPEGVDLIHELGLGGDLVHPVTAAASIYGRGRLHPLPTGTVMGIPGDPETLRGLLTEEELDRVREEPRRPAPPLEQDVDVASWVAERVGPAVVDRLVEPLLGGVYAGHAARLSLAATVPTLWQHARRGGSLLHAVAAAQPPPPVSEAADPVFAGLRGGVGRLPVELVAALRGRGVEVRTGTTVRGLQRLPGTGAAWRLITGPVPEERADDVDAVVLAVPPAPAARLLADECPVAAAELAGVRTASVAVVAALIPREALRGVSGSGFLVPPVEGHPVKAVTFSAAKWAWTDQLDPDLVLVRMSLGRAGEEAVLQRDDDDLAALGVTDLVALLARPIRPAAVTVVRWGGSLPQYDVGHLDRVARIRAAVAAVPRLAVCGAVLDGVGIPACIAAADRAAAEIIAAFAGPAPLGGGADPRAVTAWSPAVRAGAPGDAPEAPGSTMRP